MTHTYTIQSFDPATGIIVVDYDSWAKRVSVKLEPDENGNVISGDLLDKYLQSIPPPPVTIKNASEVSKLVSNPKPLLQFNPLDWYWVVGGNTSQVYSTKVKGYVSITDLNYVSWLSLGGVPNIIDTDANMQHLSYNIFNKPILSIQFKMLFTHEEWSNIVKAAQSNVDVFSWLLDIAMSHHIHFNDPIVTNGVAALVTASLLTSSRASMILSNTAHS
jgi:hypothetical protein